MIRSAYVHTVLDEKFVRLGVPFIRTKLTVPKLERLTVQTFHNVNAKIEVKFLAGKVENLSGALVRRFCVNRASCYASQE